MFKKLKEKITEEVKSSPQRFQQLTQSVSDRLQNASTSDENFFSIGDDDANMSNTSLDAGFTNVSLMSPQESKFRRNSTSSVASDVSFLPRYESVANMYHLQSDLDVSASEMEDNASTSSQLGHLSKEQIYAAFQKTQMRYHKYRGRYTDLAKHYKELERENAKMKSVLVETQDKAIRRVTELKEQCALEQKAKAHLEGALRDELDEKQFKIQSLQTKIELLQTGAPSNDSENLETLNKYLTDARQEIESLNEKIQELKANAIIFQTKEQEYKLKVSSLEKEISMFSEREKENNLSLAQNKMELHNELLSKDNEISKLKEENETLKTNLEVVTTTGGKLENLQTQNKKLIDKLENLTQKCNGYENDLLKMEQFRIELQNTNQLNAELKIKLSEAEDKLEEVREDTKKSLLTLESKIEEKLQRKFDQKEEEMRSDLHNKLEELSSKESNLNELAERDEEIKKLKEVNEELLEELTSKSAKYEDLERNHLEVIEESVGLRSKISSLEKETARLLNLNQAADLNIARLQADLEKESHNCRKLEDNLQELRKENDSRKSNEEVLRTTLQKVEEENANLLEQLEDKRKEIEARCSEIAQLNHEIELIHQRDENLEEKKKNLEGQFEEVRAELLKKLQASETEVKRLEETNSTSSKELEAKSEEIGTLKQELQNSVQISNELTARLRAVEANLNQQEVAADLQKDLAEKLNKSESRIKETEATNSELMVKVRGLEEEVMKLVAGLEAERCVVQSSQDRIKELEGVNTTLQDKREEKLTTINDLKVELSTLIGKDEELKVKAEELRQRDEELTHMKKLLEETNSSLSAKDYELQSFKEVCADSDGRVSALMEDIERRQKHEEEKMRGYENDLKSKDEEIHLLSKKLEEYHELIEERNEGLAKIFNNFPRSPNNFHNVEERLQNFEKTFSFEKENLSRILAYLKQFEERTTSEKNQLENEKEELLADVEALRSQISEVNSTRASTKQLEDELVRLKEENGRLEEEHKKLSQTLLELESRNTQVVSDSNFLSEENNGLLTEIEELKLRNEELAGRSSTTQIEIDELRQNVLKNSEDYRKQLSEFERSISELQHEKQLLREEIDELKTAPVQNSKPQEENYVKEIENLRTKVVQYKSLDLTNRSSIEFYENELQKLKNQNEKLNRKLDETLVTLNHCSELSNSTEIEYLRNVLYNYMLGKESLVLARVIAAVCKFDPHQTETILAKEQQKQTLLGQLGIL